MNRKEIINLLAIATANFPNMQERDMKPTAVLWEKSLSDIEYGTAEKALLKVLSTSRFFPTIAELREAIADITNPRSIDAMEAWGLIGQAIRKYGFYRQAEAVASLPSDVADMVKRFTWRELCLSENIDTIRAQFRMAWETQSKRKKEMNALPVDIRNLLESSTRPLLLNKGEHE
ncbi:replicative helicase loader/inhibitor [Acinetobacter baumannii]